MSHQFEPAVENYLKALQLDPGALTGTDGNPMPDVMAILARPEFLPRTTEAFQVVLANDANNLQAHYALADLYKRTGSCAIGVADAGSE